MLYLFWGLLNLALIVLYLRLLFFSLRNISRKNGILAAILVFMLFPGTLSQAGTKKAPPQYFEMAKGHDSSRMFTTVFSVEDYKLFKKEVILNYEKHQKIEVLAMQGMESGWNMGVRWQPTSITAHQDTKSQKVNYAISAKIDWMILSIPIFTTTETINGTVQIK